jgi:hypothetical protein
MFTSPARSLHELAGNSHDVVAYRSYVAFCASVDVNPMPFTSHFELRQKELEEFVALPETDDETELESEEPTEL